MPSFVSPAKKNRKSVPSNHLLKKPVLWIFLPVLFLFFIDRISKFWIDHFLSGEHSFPIIPDVLHLTRVHNTGVAFGLFKGAGVLLIVLTVVSIGVIGLYLFKSWPLTRRMQRLGWILILGGALGNLYDRLVYRYVIDFIDFRVWPVFNLADSFVCIGVWLIVFNALTEKQDP